ncbi:MAG: RSP_7527 family protein [Alkalilacustris sp.]
MTDRPTTDKVYFEMPEYIDMVAVERRAREMRAEAFGNLMRMIGAAVSRRIAAIRGARVPGQSRPA